MADESHKGMVDRAFSLVANISTWKQALIFIVIGFTTLVGVMLYQHPHWIESLWQASHPQAPTLVARTQIEAEVETLRKGLGARWVAVAAAAPAKNMVHIIASACDGSYAAKLDELRAERWSLPVPMFGEDATANSVMVKVLSGETVCSEGLTAAKIRASFETTHACIAGIPPGTEDFLGFVIAGFIGELDKGEETRIRAVLRAKAEEWTDWH